MLSDDRPLPHLAQAVVLHELGLVRTDELPRLASRWLAADVFDSESIRELAGTATSDVWTIDRLLAGALDDFQVTVPAGDEDRERMAIDWVVGLWREDRDTRSAIETLARLGQTCLSSRELGFFVGLDDELLGGWGRTTAEVEAEAAAELARLAST